MSATVYTSGCFSPAKANIGSGGAHPQGDHYLTWAAAAGSGRVFHSISLE